jgi:hypothetical protein
LFHKFSLDEYKFGGYGRGINEFLEPNGITFLSDGTVAVVDTNSSQVKLFDPVRRECVLKFGQAGTRPGALLYPYRIAVLPGHDLVRCIFFYITGLYKFIIARYGSTISTTNDTNI